MPRHKRKWRGHTPTTIDLTATAEPLWHDEEISRAKAALRHIDLYSFIGFPEEQVVREARDMLLDR